MSYIYRVNRALLKCEQQVSSSYSMFESSKLIYHKKHFAFLFLIIAMLSGTAICGNYDLQGQSKGSTEWIQGNLKNWAEGDCVPFRMVISETATPSFYFEIAFDYEKAGIYGFLFCDNFYINPAQGSISWVRLSNYVSGQWTMGKYRITVTPAPGVTNFEVYWCGRLSNNAGLISGASLHMEKAYPPGTDAVPLFGDVIISGTISGYKYNDLNANGILDTGEPPLSNWKITLADSDPSTPDVVTYTNSLGYYVFNNLALGTYTVTEEDKPGWQHTTPSSITGSITYDGEDKIANFLNTQRGRIIVKKDAIPDDPHDFSFLGTGGIGSFYLDDDSDGTLSNVASFGLDPGSYDITEGSVPEGWKLTHIECSGGSSSSCVDIIQDEILVGKRINLAPTETVTVTFFNEKCQVVEAGMDQMICADEYADLAASALYYTGTPYWSIESETPGGTEEGQIIPLPGEEGNPLKARYIPPLTGVNEAVLSFTAEGACDPVVDHVTIYVIEKPNAEIRYAE